MGVDADRLQLAVRRLFEWEVTTPIADIKIGEKQTLWITLGGPRADMMKGALEARPGNRSLCLGRITKLPLPHQPVLWVFDPTH